jgi:hypothetical protein
LLNTFIGKMALGLCISFIDLSTRRNIEQTTPKNTHSRYGNGQSSHIQHFQPYSAFSAENAEYG